MAKVLVVGGAGYIGSHVAKSLVNAGHKVMIFDDLSTGFRELARYGAFTFGNILHRQVVEELLQNFKPDAMMHFAARAAVGESVQKPSLYYEVNVLGTFELLDAIRRTSPNTKVIFSSTCAVYGATDERLHEKLPLAPVNPYGRTKKIIDEMLADYNSAYGLKYTSLRYFNASGADSEGELGEMHNPETHLIPLLLENIYEQSSDTVKVFGNDYPTPDGTCIRDYIHVEDLARAHILAMDRLLKGGESEIFNLGTAKGSSVLEVAHMVEKVTGKKLKLQIAPRRAGDPPRLVANSTKIETMLAWKPAHNLEQIVESAWRWTNTRLR